MLELTVILKLLAWPTLHVQLFDETMHKQVPSVRAQYGPKVAGPIGWHQCGKGVKTPLSPQSDCIAVYCEALLIL